MDQQLKKREQQKKEAQEAYRSSITPTKHVPMCPTCGSIKVNKITTASRLLSVGVLGLASSKVGKTMECKNCGYKW